MTDCFADPISHILEAYVLLEQCRIPGDAWEEHRDLLGTIDAKFCADCLG